MCALYSSILSSLPNLSRFRAVSNRSGFTVVFLAPDVVTVVVVIVVDSIGLSFSVARMLIDAHRILLLRELFLVESSGGECRKHKGPRVSGSKRVRGLRGRVTRVCARVRACRCVRKRESVCCKRACELACDTERTVNDRRARTPQGHASLHTAESARVATSLFRNTLDLYHLFSRAKVVSKEKGEYSSRINPN